MPGGGAGAYFQNVSFINYTRAGFIADRRSKVDDSPRIHFINCDFKTTEKNYNCRAISFDAGNTEYLIVWNLNKSTVNNCRFERTEIGLSKSSNLKILNPYFYVDNTYMDIIHMEEYSDNILIKGNVFEHKKLARGIYKYIQRYLRMDIISLFTNKSNI